MLSAIWCALYFNTCGQQFSLKMIKKHTHSLKWRIRNLCNFLLLFSILALPFKLFFNDYNAWIISNEPPTTGSVGFNAPILEAVDSDSFAYGKTRLNHMEPLCGQGQVNLRLSSFCVKYCTDLSLLLYFIIIKFVYTLLSQQCSMQFTITLRHKHQ